MNIVDVKEIIEKLKIGNTLSKTFAKKTNIPESELKEIFDHIVEKQINNIGKSFSSDTLDRKTSSRLQGLSLDDFMKDNDKIIKDE